MQGTILDNCTIVSKDKQYYRFTPGEIKNGVMDIGKKVEFKPNGINAKEIHIIDEFENINNDIKTDLKTQININAKKARFLTKDTYNVGSADTKNTLLIQAKQQGVLSGFIYLTSFFLLFIFSFLQNFKENMALIFAISDIIYIAGCIPMYFALKKISDISNSPVLHINYKNSILFLISEFILITIFIVFLFPSSVFIGILSTIVFITIVIYIFILWIKVFLELAELTDNNLFKKYIYFHIEAIILSFIPLVYILGFIFTIATLFFYIYAWQKTDKILNYKNIYIS